MADPVRDLNNFLQGQPGGSVTKDFKWNLTKEGPEHDTVYHVTAVCKHALCDTPFFFFHSCTTVRGVNVGVGHGSSMGSAKRNASVQALEYLRQHGKGCIESNS
jgi:dsRNA-specific ribonuclease